MGSLDGAMARPFKCISDCNILYFQFVKINDMQLEGLIDRHCPYSKKQGSHFAYHTTLIYIHNNYIELACHGEQNGSKKFILRTRITELWRFKAHKVENKDKEDGLLFFKPSL